MWRSCSLTEMIGAGTKLFETLGPGRLFALRPIGFLRTIGQVKRPLWTPKTLNSRTHPRFWDRYRKLEVRKKPEKPIVFSVRTSPTRVCGLSC